MDDSAFSTHDSASNLTVSLAKEKESLTLRIVTSYCTHSDTWMIVCTTLTRQKGMQCKYVSSICSTFLITYCTIAVVGSTRADESCKAGRTIAE